MCAQIPQGGEFMEEPISDTQELGALNEPGPPRQIREFSVDEVQPVVEKFENTDSSNDAPTKEWLFRYLYGHLGNI